jgi:Outer membrane receptor proteins, mostly Fe transport
MLTAEFDLLQQPIIESASKRAESVFESPLSADVVTRDMILKSGARNIPEALRLLPGMIVREVSSGNFDVHIRGLDNIPPGGVIHDFPSTTVLVMIDYRPVYSYSLGGTYWETLPIDIVDVERIELVRGPAAALYGPNAVTGVINIITRKPTANGPQVSARAEGALTSRDPDWKDNYRVGERSVSGRFAYKYNAFSGGASANYRHFDRLVDGIFSYASNRRVSPDQLTVPLTLTFGGFNNIAGQTMRDKGMDPRVVFPEPSLGQRAVGANAFAAYEPNDKLSITLTGGYQESRAVGDEFFDTYSFFTPFATNDSQSWYLDLRTRAYNFTFQASFASGHQFIPMGGIDLPDGSKGETNNFRYNTLDLYLDYDYAWEWLRVRPAVSYRRAQYSGLAFATWDCPEGTTQNCRNTGESPALQSAAVSVALEQTPWKKLRFIEAVRLDIYFDRTEDHYYPVGATDYDSPETKNGKMVYPSFEFAVTYMPADNHLLRASYGHANRSPTVFNAYLNEPGMGTTGNKALDLMTVDTVELGYRSHLAKQVEFSFEIFGTYARDFSTTYNHGEDTSDLSNIKLINLADNFDLKVYQVGSTASLGFTSHHFQGHLFATIQQTFIRDFNNSVLGFAILGSIKKVDEMHLGTPDVFGGLYLNYQPLDPLNINVNVYYLSRCTLIHSDIPMGNVLAPSSPSLSGSVSIQESFILNAKVSYDFWKGLAAYVNVRNALNINQAQFIWGDPNHVLVFLGLQYEH